MLEPIIMLCALIVVVCVALVAIALFFGGRDEW